MLTSLLDCRTNSLVSNDFGPGRGKLSRQEEKSSCRGRPASIVHWWTRAAAAYCVHCRAGETGSPFPSWEDCRITSDFRVFGNKGTRIKADEDSKTH
ncbi:hypothetical protein C4K40_0710 [Pseudomonas sp. CMR5c]|nr:hypothetical protein C4K40_0710 [Pseudomonas sp. CMR5c]